MAKANNQVVAVTAYLENLETGPGVSRGWKKMGDAIKKDVAMAMTGALNSGFNQARATSLKNFTDKFKASMIEADRGIAKVEIDLRKHVLTIRKVEQALNVKGLKAAEKYELESQHKKLKEKERDLHAARARHTQTIRDEQAEFDKKAKNLIKIQERRMRAEKRLGWDKKPDYERKGEGPNSKLSIVGQGQRLGAWAEDAGHVFGSAIEEAFKTIETRDLPGFISKLGKGISKAGDMAEAKSSDSAMGGIFGGLGTLLKTIGPVVAGIGALIGGVAALFGLVMDARKEVQEYNKSLFDAGVTAGDLAKKSWDLKGSVDNLRKGFRQATDFNMEWGVTAKENLQILGAYAQAGIVIDEIAQKTDNATDSMDRFKVASETALTYAKLFGVEVNTMAENVGSYMENLGMTFESMQESLSAIHTAAMDSGFGVKRFYGMVLQATSGMSMYNVRLSETAGLMASLGKILGAKEGAEMVTKALQGNMGMSTLDREKRVRLRGKSETMATARQAAGYNAEDMIRKINSFAETNKDKGKDLKDAISKALGKDFAKLTGTEFASRLGNLDSEKRSTMMAEIKAANQDMVKVMQGLYGQSQGYRKGPGAAQAAFQFLSPGAKIWEDMNQLEKVLQGKNRNIGSIDLTNVQDRAVVEHMGMSPEDFEKNRGLYESRKGDQDSLSKAQKEIQKIAETDMQAAMAKMGEFNLKMGKSIGVGLKLDENNQVVRARAQFMEGDAGEKQGMLSDDAMTIGNTLKDLFLTEGLGTEESAKDQVDENKELAKEQVQRTIDVYHAIEVMKDSVMEDIYESTEGIGDILTDLLGTLVEFFTGKTFVTSAQRQYKREATEDLAHRAGKAQGQLGELKGSKTQMLAMLKHVESDPQYKAMTLRSYMKNHKGLSEEDAQKGLDAENNRRSEAKTAQLDELNSGLTQLDKSIEAQNFQVAKYKGGLQAARRMSGRGTTGSEDFAATAMETGISKLNMGEAGLSDDARNRINSARYGGPGAEDQDAWRKQRDIEAVKQHGVSFSAAQEYQKDTGLAGKEAGKGLGLVRKIQEKQTKEAKRQSDEQKTRDVKLHETVKGSPQETATEIDKKAQERLDEQLAGYLSAPVGNYDDALAMASRMRSGGATAADLKLMKEPAYAKQIETFESHGLSMGKYQGAPKTQDLVVQVGNDGRIKYSQRVDPGDVGVFSKPGGAIDQARGGRATAGGGMNVFHLYGEGPGVMNTIVKAQQAGMLG